MSSITDHQHIQRVLDGDKSAFRYFVRNYQEMGYSIAISIVKKDEEAKDAVQNAFIRVFKSLRSFRQDAKFSTWFYKIVVNESLKQLKKSKINHETISFRNDPKEYGVVFNEVVNNLEVAERNVRIDKVLRLMKPKEALVLKLHYLNEQRIDEIVKITGFSKSNIKVLLFRARKSFSALFVQYKNQ